MSCVNCVADVENFVISAIKPSLTFHGRRTSLVRTPRLLLVDMTQYKCQAAVSRRGLWSVLLSNHVQSSWWVKCRARVWSTCVVHVCGSHVWSMRVAVSLSDEQQIERMYEMLDSHQKRAAAAAAASGPVQSSTRRDTRTDTDTGQIRRL